MPERVEDSISVNKSAAIRVIVLLAIIIFAASGWFWWRNVYMGQQNVFWAMIDNNLATNNITRHVEQKNQSQSLEQYIQLEFGAVNATHSLITLKQTNNQGQTTVKSETIGTPSTDYNRYLSISTPQKNSKDQPIDTSNIIGIWSKSQRSASSQPGTGQYFSQSILSIVPYGNFNQATRRSLIQFMKGHKVYTPSPNAKSDKINGRPVFVYDVAVDPSSYIECMAQYAKDLGLGDLGLDPTQYAGSPALKVQFTVDKLSRNLLKINYPSAGQEETFYSQGLEQQITEPSKTIPLSELQGRIQTVLN